MDAKKQELLIPPLASSDPKAREMLRAWIAHEGLHCSLNVGSWGDKEEIGWGILLSDAARHVADALFREKGVKQVDTLREIRRVFNDELDDPTSETKGEFVQ
ncbi:MAG: DUF5076 domain-containing protein [Terriglobales bacterium]